MPLPFTTVPSLQSICTHNAKVNFECYLFYNLEKNSRGLCKYHRKIKDNIHTKSKYKYLGRMAEILCLCTETPRVLTVVQHFPKFWGNFVFLKIILKNCSALSVLGMPELFSEKECFSGSGTFLHSNDNNSLQLLFFLKKLIFLKKTMIPRV